MLFSCTIPLALSFASWFSYSHQLRLVPAMTMDSAAISTMCILLDSPTLHMLGSHQFVSVSTLSFVALIRNVDTRTLDWHQLLDTMSKLIVAKLLSRVPALQGKLTG